MLFRKEVPRSCSYCVYSTRLDDEQVLCVKYGVVCRENGCRKFSYDPCKRIPAKPKAMDFRQFDKEDYSL